MNAHARNTGQWRRAHRFPRSGEARTDLLAPVVSLCLALWRQEREFIDRVRAEQVGESVRREVEHRLSEAAEQMPGRRGHEVVVMSGRHNSTSVEQMA